MSIKVLFVTQYGVQGASSRTRVFQYLPHLHRHGVRARVITVLPDRSMAGARIQVTRHAWRKLLYYMWAAWRTLACGLHAWWAAPGFDVLFVQKVIFPRPIRWLLRRRRPPLLYDFDDAIFTTEVRRQNWLAAWKRHRNARGLPAMLAMADWALVENEYTAAFALRCGPRVATITGPIDTRRYCANGRTAAGDRVVLGWIGSSSTLPYLELIRTPLARLGRRFAQLRLCIVGAGKVDLEGIVVETRAWSLEGEVEALRGFDIGLMPMPDNAWTRGKGGYKLLQYMALGLPVVTSPVGVNQQIVRDGESGFWARDERQWEECLARLLEDPQLRRRMGRRGRQRVEAEYALDIGSAHLLDILRKMAEEG